MEKEREKETETEEKKDLFKGMKWMVGGGIATAVILLILFLLNQTYDTSLPFDTGIFGTYGDFIGGVLGTVVALYSAFLLIKTFQNQARINEDVKKTNASVISTNQSVVDTNNSIVAANAKADAAAQKQYYLNILQTFDSKFNSFLDSYHRAISAYTNDKKTGRAAFEEIALTFINGEFENNNDYKHRCESATDEYLVFYAENQNTLSVHLRMLYLLVSLISKSDLEDEDKVEYAKLVRGQMSDAEMLLVRYNCRSHYGMKMQIYCNQYNLTKHLPITSLLEFKEYKKIVVEKQPQESSKLLSGLDVMFITLRKRATKMLYDDNVSCDEYTTSHRYTIKLSYPSSDNQTFMLELTKDKQIDRRGAGKRVSPDENALDCFTAKQLVDMFKDFVNELFVTSNFDKYNEGVEIQQVGPFKDTDKITNFKIKASNDKQLALSYIQANKRDNPVGELE